MSEDYKSYAVNVSIPEPLKGWELDSTTLKATLYMKTYESQKEVDAQKLVDNVFRSNRVTIDSIVETNE
jgi:hypothetical protein